MRHTFSSIPFSIKTSEFPSNYSHLFNQYKIIYLRINDLNPEIYSTYSKKNRNKKNIMSKTNNSCWMKGVIGRKKIKIIWNLEAFLEKKVVIIPNAKLYEQLFKVDK